METCWWQRVKLWEGKNPEDYKLTQRAIRIHATSLPEVAGFNDSIDVEDNHK
jgi:hypothetical protein